MKYERFLIFIWGICLLFLISCGILVILVDPFFHYHKPIEQLQYPMLDSMERYINDGITRNFDYDAFITGTSMTENFKTSEFDQLFGVRSIKVPYSGASYREINEGIQRALEYNENISCVLRGLDLSKLVMDKDYYEHGVEQYPWYLFDQFLLNDVAYLFNKDVLIKCLDVFVYTLEGHSTPSFDEYACWDVEENFGKESVLSRYKRLEKQPHRTIAQEDYETIHANIEQNVTRIIASNPQVEFIYFITPYSIVYWDNINQSGMVDYMIDAQRVLIEEMLRYDNVKLYSFFTNYEMVCNLNNYRDANHYSGQINSKLLWWMANGEYQLTKDNYEQYLNEISVFYNSFDYDSIFE